MENLDVADELTTAYVVRFRSAEVPVHPRKFTSRERLDRQSRYGRRAAAPNLRDGAPRRSNKWSF